MRLSKFPIQVSDAIHLSRVIGPEALLDGVGEDNCVVRGFNVARARSIGEVFLQKASRRIPGFVGVKALHVQIEGALRKVLAQPAHRRLRHKLRLAILPAASKDSSSPCIGSRNFAGLGSLPNNPVGQCR